MPELPEVETTVRRIQKIVGKKIFAATLLWKKSVAIPKADIFVKEIKGAKISAITRRGKFLVFELKKKKKLFYMLAHKRMSGSFFIVKKNNPMPKHTRIYFTLSDGSYLCFNDPRKFGKFYLLDDKEKVLGKLGVEPLSKDLSQEYLTNILLKRKTKIKQLLLDQSIIAGIGNIYADEALWKAGIHPATISSRLIKPEVSSLIKSIRFVLTKAIQNEGTDFGDNVVEGNHAPRIYGRPGEKCPKCKHIIIKTIVGQRGTHYCPKCQVKK